MVNGWTSDAGLGASWHELGNGAACLSCLYQPIGTAPSQTDLAAQALGLPSERVVLLWVNATALSNADLETVAEHLSVDAAKLAPWRGKRIQELYAEIICGTAAMDVAGSGRQEAVPLAHQSVLAGVLAAAELAKRIDPVLAARSQGQATIAWHDVMRPPPSHWTQPRAPVQGCICADDDYLTAYARKWLKASCAEARP